MKNGNVPLYRFSLGVPLLFGLALLTLSFGAGCGRAPEEKREIVRFWHGFTMKSEPGYALDTLVKKFNSSQDQYEVRVLLLPDLQLIPKLLTSIAGRVPPDVVLFNRPFLAGFIARGAFRPIDDLIQGEDIRGEDFFSAAWEGNNYEGHTYGLPLNTDVRVLYYNRAHFREVGLDPDRPPRTWSELADYAQRLTVQDENGRLERIGYAPVGRVFDNTYIYLYGWQNGGRFLSDDGRRLTLNHPKNVEALGWMTDIVRTLGYERLLAVEATSTGSFHHPFFTDQLSICGNECFLLSHIRRYAPDLDFSVAPLPYPEGGKHVTWSGGFSLAVPNEARNLLGAWTFMRWMTSYESQLYFGETSEQLPALRKATDAPYVHNDPAWQVFVSEMNYSRPLPLTPVAMEMFDELNFAMSAAYHEDVTPQEALDHAQTVCQTSLDTYLNRTASPPIPERMLTICFIIAIVSSVTLWLFRRRKMFTGRTAASVEARWGLFFTAPALLGFLGLVALPAMLSALYSLCDYGVLQPARWTGLDNYAELFGEDQRFTLSLWNTVYYVVLSVPLGMATALAVALFLQRSTPLTAVARMCFYMPSIMPAVALAVLWLLILNPDFGLLNAVLGFLGFDGPLWLQSTRWAKPGLVLMSLWCVGPWMVIYVAALQGIPGHLMESAALDGAGPWSRFRHVVVPLISPSLFFTAVMGVVGALQMFTQVYVMTDGVGGPLDSTLFYVLYLYRKAFNHVEMGYASAMAWILFWVVLALTALQFAGARRWVHYEQGD